MCDGIKETYTPGDGVTDDYCGWGEEWMRSGGLWMAIVRKKELSVSVSDGQGQEEKEGCLLILVFNQSRQRRPPERLITASFRSF